MAEDRGPEVLGVAGVFLSLSWLFVCLRMYVKAFLTKSWGSDDGLLVVAAIFFTTYCACGFMGVKNGTGRHPDNISLEELPVALYYWWLCELFYTITTVFIRLSVAVFLLRICTKRVHKWIIYGTLASVIIFSTFYFFLVMFQCTPVRFFWGQYEGVKGSCINPAIVPNATIAHSVVSFAADWILGLLPIALIWHLQMNFRTKVSVAAVLSMGLLAGVATMIRIPYIKVLAITNDFLFVTTDVAIWSTIEPALGIIATAAATLRPLFRTFYSLSTRGETNQKSTHRTSRWRNSHAGYIKNESDNNQNTSGSTSEIYGGIQLRSDIGSVSGKSRNRGDQQSGVYEGGINVHKTVIVTSAENSDDDSEPNTPWPIQGKRISDKDLV